MKLFDDGRHCVNSWERTSDLSKFAFCNSDWSLGDESVLDNSAVRDRCERWFQRIPEGRRADLHAEFRSTDDSAHEGAFFELFLHELLTVLGCVVEFQPEVGGKTPDFLLAEGEESIFVEATVARYASNPLLAGANEQKVLDYISRLRSSHFSLLYDVDNRLNATSPWTTPPRKYVISEVKRLLGSNEPSDVGSTVETFGRKAAPSSKIEWRDGTMTVWLSPRSVNQRAKSSDERIVISRMNAKRIDPISSIRRALEAKAKAYKELDVPLLLAVNAANPSFSTEARDLNVLWGDSHAEYEMKADEPVQYSQQGNDFWSRSRSGNVAGVLIFRNADIRNMWQSYASLYLNPRYLRGPAVPDALMRFPHYIETDGSPVRREGENVAQVMGVSLV